MAPRGIVPERSASRHALHTERCAIDLKLRPLIGLRAVTVGRSRSVVASWIDVVSATGNLRVARGRFGGVRSANFFGRFRRILWLRDVVGAWDQSIVPGVDGGELVRAQFLAFYDAAVGPLFGYLYRASGGQRELAEDLCQDVFATVLTRVRGGDVSVLTVPWVIAVGRNRLIDQWRRSARQERRLSQLSTNQPVATASVDDDLLAWIAQLPASQRAAVVLHYLDDLPVHEVATRLGKSYKSTESLLSRARQSLRTSGGGDHV